MFPVVYSYDLEKLKFEHLFNIRRHVIAEICCPLVMLMHQLSLNIFTLWCNWSWKRKKSIKTIYLHIVLFFLERISCLIFIKNIWYYRFCIIYYTMYIRSYKYFFINIVLKYIDKVLSIKFNAFPKLLQSRDEGLYKSNFIKCEITFQYILLKYGAWSYTQFST